MQALLLTLIIGMAISLADANGNEAQVATPDLRADDQPDRLGDGVGSSYLPTIQGTEADF
jgi:hypothetical protein